MFTEGKMMSGLPHRRRFIAVTAAAAGLGLGMTSPRAAAGSKPVVWRGQVMGAAASLQIYHPDRTKAERTVASALSEVQRLERTFSLYRDDTDLVRLNRDGILLNPSADLTSLLSECRRLWNLTGGAFDPTVQPLWSLYSSHFSKPGHDPRGPSADKVRTALDKVGFSHVLVDRNRIVLGRRGMSLTLNGVAQGYVTDRVVELLRSEGITHTLVDMGESRTLGERPDGSPWRVGIADPDLPDRVREELNIREGAVATSGGYGFQFDSEGRYNHLLDPASGASAHRYKSVTVLAATAALADGLSTAFSLLPQTRISTVLEDFGNVQVRLIGKDGQSEVLTAHKQ